MQHINRQDAQLSQLRHRLQRAQVADRPGAGATDITNGPYQQARPRYVSRPFACRHCRPDCNDSACGRDIHNTCISISRSSGSGSNSSSASVTSELINTPLVDLEHDFARTDGAQQSIGKRRKQMSLVRVSHRCLEKRGTVFLPVE
jgi:hypothetical protein